MPVYEYECSACQHHFERKQGFHEEPVAVCPVCEGEARRVICSVSVIFKGSGFYVTDHRKHDSITEGEGPKAGKQKGK